MNYKRTCLVAAVGITFLMPGLLMMPCATAETASWTIALYVNGDNDLERYWEEYSLPALLNIPASPGLNIVAVMDRESTQGTELIEISGGSWQVVGTYPEKNFGDGATFQWFITEMDTLYPSDKLAITGWDHGYAWRYFSDDQTSGDRITMPELQAAIENAGVYIDILAFDACNMAAVEVVYQVSLTGLVGILVGSEETIPMNGFPYDLMLTPVALDPMRTPAQVAVDMVDGYEAYYAPLSWATTVGLSAVDVATIGNSASTIQTWVAEMHANLGAYYKSYKSALKYAYVAWATYYHVDLADLGDELLAISSIKDPDLRAATASVVALVDSSVLDVWGGFGAEQMRGITIWWGVRGDWTFYAEAYADVDFAVDMGWWNFLNDYN